jgi:uncharacterized surface protein with fasciclin (FAS1) repeats
MSNKGMFALQLKRAIALAAIVVSGSLISLPVFAGSDSSKKPASATEATQKPADPSVSSPTMGSPTMGSPTMAPPATTVPATDPPTVVPATPTEPSARPGETTTAPAKGPDSPTATMGTIVEVASSNASFETLVTAAKAAGMMDVLSSQGPYTVFAPTNEAFAALPKGTVEALLKPENRAKLRKVLSYHVVSGAVESSAIKPGQVKTVEGKPISLRMMGSKIMVNDANVTSADIKASNGVIHAIDKVILPPDL